MINSDQNQWGDVGKKSETKKRTILLRQKDKRHRQGGEGWGGAEEVTDMVRKRTSELRRRSQTLPEKGVVAATTTPERSIKGGQKRRRTKRGTAEQDSRKR